MAALRTLDGIRIAAFTQFLLGPAAVQYLADLGADVVKVEPPGGAWERRWTGADCRPGGTSGLFLLANRNCRSLALDLKSDAGRRAALRLVRTADVVVENFRPGVMDRLGLGYDAARAVRPDVIYASASGYGADGPSRDEPGQDLLIQAVTGIASLSGTAGQDPVPVGFAAVDQHGAALLAMGVLAALLHRERTGEGQRLEVAMALAALDLATEPVVYRLNGSRVERPAEPLASSFHAAPYGVYRTADGHVALSIATVAAVAAALGGVPALAGLEDPAVAFSRRDEIRAALGPVVERHPTADLLARLRAHGIWCAPVHDLDQALADPGLRHLDPVLEVGDGQGGTARVLRHPIRYGAGEPALRRSPPAAGEHTDEILRELGEL